MNYRDKLLELATYAQENAARCGTATSYRLLVRSGSDYTIVELQLPVKNGWWSCGASVAAEPRPTRGLAIELRVNITFTVCSEYAQAKALLLGCAQLGRIAGAFYERVKDQEFSV